MNDLTMYVRGGGVNNCHFWVPADKLKTYTTRQLKQDVAKKALGEHAEFFHLKSLELSWSGRTTYVAVEIFGSESELLLDFLYSKNMDTKKPMEITVRTWENRCRFSSSSFVGKIRLFSPYSEIDLHGSHSDMIYAEDSGYHSAVAMVDDYAPYFPTFQVYRSLSGEVDLKLDARQFKLERLVAGKRRVDVPLEVDEKSMTYAFGVVANVTCRLATLGEWKTGLYEASFGKDRSTISLVVRPAGSDNSCSSSGSSSSSSGSSGKSTGASVGVSPKEWRYSTESYYDYYRTYFYIGVVKCTVCLQKISRYEQMKLFACNDCLATTCKSCIDAYYKKHREEKLSCFVCKGVDIL